MSSDAALSPRAVIEELATHPRGEELASLVHTLAFSAYDERRTHLAEGLDEVLSRLGLDEGAAETGLGNAVRALRREQGHTASERLLLSTLLAKAVLSQAPLPGVAASRVAQALSWLGAHSVVDALFVLAALGRGEVVLGELSALVQNHDEGTQSQLDRASAIVACVALSKTEQLVPTNLRDPVLTSLLAKQVVHQAAVHEPLLVSGELAPVTRGPVVTFLLSASMLLPIWTIIRGFARWVLQVRRPATARFCAEGVHVVSQLSLFGKTLSKREQFYPRSGLCRAARVVRLPNLGTYLGIGALVAGSYVGLRLVLDGLQSGAPEFLGVGVGIVIASLLADYWLSLLPALYPGSCRIELDPQVGPRVALRAVDIELADRALGLLRAAK